MRVLAGIVTYEPDLKRLSQCLEAAFGQSEHVLIIDNGSSNLSEICCLADKKAEVISNKKNEGIARALNQIFEYAWENNYSWVLTLDQDTVIPEGMIKAYHEVLDAAGSDSVAILCPRIHDVQCDRIWPNVEQNVRFLNVDRCITSGSINSVAAWKKVNGFDEYLFIDEVDHDFCYRIRHENLNILLCSDLCIEHQIGNTKIYSFFGFPIYVRNHSAFRKYYITRNILYVSRKHHGYIQFKEFIHAIAFLLKTVVFEDNKKQKLFACCRGLYDGLRNMNG